jgi:hypothetical protein
MFDFASIERNEGAVKRYERDGQAEFGIRDFRVARRACPEGPERGYPFRVALQPAGRRGPSWFATEHHSPSMSSTDFARAMHLLAWRNTASLKAVCAPSYIYIGSRLVDGMQRGEPGRDGAAQRSPQGPGTGEQIFVPK